MAKKSEVIETPTPSTRLGDYVSSTSTDPYGKRLTREGVAAPDTDARREQAGLQGKLDADYRIREWQRTRPEEPIDAESFRAACVAAALAKYDEEQRRQADERERSRALREKAEQRQQAERAQVVSSLVGRLSAEELAGRLLDAVEVLQLARVRVPVGLLA